MVDLSRRAALKTLSALTLTACGGGSGDRATAPIPSAPLPNPPTEPLPSPPSPSAGSFRQFRTWDAGSGPSRDFWSRHLRMRWTNAGIGDWLDATGAPQGATPYASTSVEKAGTWYQFDATQLVRRWLGSGFNRGFMLKIAGRRSPSITWGGRVSPNPPRMLLTLSGGETRTMSCEAFSGFSQTSVRGLDTRERSRTSEVQTSIIQFDLTSIHDEIASAAVNLYCEAVSGTATLEVYECNPPAFQLGAEGQRPVMGLAAETPEAALSQHPNVIRAGDFSDLGKGVLLDSLSLSEHSSNQQLADPDAPGTVMFRGSFTPNGRGSFSGRVETMRADPSDPLRSPATVETEMFCRVYIFLEDDWRSTLDANKMAIGWDLRMGWWNDANGGYWQSTTGNGGARGTGLKLFAPAKSNGGSQLSDRWEYQGHSIRMEAGIGTDDGNPYESLRPLETYVYHLDQPTGYGQVYRLGNAVLQRGRWHCIEQQIRVNSVIGPFDQLGNGQAVPDGVLRTWLDGVLVSEITNLRWRRNLEMGVQGPWINWYYGGKQATERTMHYRMNHFVLARKYIGPRVG